METGGSASVYSAYSRVRSIPRTSPPELTISVTTSPHPPRRFTSRRNAVSVMPAIGARPNAGARLIEPIFIAHFALVRPDIRPVDFAADSVADQIDRENKAPVGTLPHCPPSHCL